MSAGPRFEMVQNPDFSFPPLPLAHPASAPLLLDSSPTLRPVLPTFRFNATDASGLRAAESDADTATPADEPPASPARRRHRRGGSELVGGDPRRGASVISVSPTKPNDPPAVALPPPTLRHGHAHRRSAAISSHDLSAIMLARPESMPRTSTSLPTTPLEEQPPDRVAARGRMESAPVLPPSRPRVEFSDHVEYIPRPLSTISSGTESSVSTIRGDHSVNNSLTSVLSMSAASPPSSRPGPPSPRVRPGEDPRLLRPCDSRKHDESARVTVPCPLKRPVSDPAAASNTVAWTDPASNTVGWADPATRPRTPHKKKHHFGEALGFDRRRSEPSMSVYASHSSGWSSVSLQDSSANRDPSPSRGISTKRIKAWASSKMPKRGVTISQSSSRSSIRPESPLAPPEREAETDLDAVFSGEVDMLPPPPLRHLDMSSLRSFERRHTAPEAADDHSPMLDLDAALGPFQTPTLGGSTQQRHRRELHSSRPANHAFSGPRRQFHRRTESAPALASVDAIRARGSVTRPMADVFEEEEDEDGKALTAADHSVGFSVVNYTLGDDSQLSLPEPGASSSVDVDPAPPPSAVQIVESHEEPRTCSRTKSSDSNETLTVLAATPAVSPPDPPSRLGTATSSHTDDRTVSSSSTTTTTTTTTAGGPRASDDDDYIPSLTSSRSTMLSLVAGPAEPAHGSPTTAAAAAATTPRPPRPRARPRAAAADDHDDMFSRRRARNSIASLSHLIGLGAGAGGDTARPRSSSRMLDAGRPATAFVPAGGEVKEHHRLKRLMFWRGRGGAGR